MSWIVEIKFELNDVEDTDVLPELLSNLGENILNSDTLKYFSIKEKEDGK
jgi:hypothetical protein|tara:strand:+ start:217 stop:366 length:150 start_codon:yes stop_codon:yes gene_type:complete